MTPKTTDQNILFLNERIPFSLHCRFNEWNAKHKMSMDDSSQEIGRDMYLQGTVMH